MISRLTRTAQTLAVVLLAYFAYAMIAAPLIEPSIEFASAKWERNPHTRVSQIDVSLFPEDAWERGEPKVLETSQGTLLFDDYRQLENGDLELPHCTLISYIDPPTPTDAVKLAEASGQSANLQENSDRETPAPAGGVMPSGGTVDPSNDSPRDAAPAARRPVVMRASQGALLRFDSPPNFVMGKFGRLVGGHLQGDVTIFSPASNASNDDALLITTKNIQIDQKRIWAPSQVDFRFGRNWAKGRDLSIYLETPQRKGATEKAPMGRIRSLELVHVDEVNLEVEGDLFASFTGQKKKDAQPTAAQTNVSSRPNPTPIAIKCQGPFRFDFDELIASLEERVDVIRHNLDGASDQLNCELLEIHLMPKASDPAQKLPGAQKIPGDANSTLRTREPSAMQPRKIIAVGFPVMIRAPSMRAGARAKRMEYDFVTRRVQLSGDETTTLFNDQYHVEASRLEYELLEGGRLGRLQAIGPGFARGQMGKEKRPFEATWAGRVSLLPQGRNKVLSLVGQASLKMAEMASLKADELHLYLLEIPRPNSDQVDVHADRMRANGNIELDSPQLIAFLAEAQVWFRAPTAAEAEVAATDKINQRESNGLFGGKAGPNGKPETKLRLTAGVLRGQIVLTETPQLEALDLHNNVRVNEYQSAGPSSLDIAAQRVLLERGNAPSAELTLTGAPARFSAEGMTLDGAVIRVQLANNVANVEGPGSMLMLPKHVSLGAAGTSKPLHVQWNQGMRFDGRTARFDGEIAARGEHVTKDQETVQFVAKGDTLEVTLNRAVTFSNPATTGVDVGQLTFPGMAVVDSRTVDPMGLVTGMDSLVVRALVMDRQTGQVTGQGPGHVIHRGPNPQKKKNQSSQPPIPELIFLRIDFENQLVGNIDQREMEFLNGTRTILGPISNWEQSLDPQRPELLGDNGVILTSRRLAVADMRELTRNKNAIEVEATGNAQIRGRRFAASGDRVSYIRAKDQLVLEGDGRTESTLRLQPREGADWQSLSAKKITFYPQTRQFALSGFELELKDVGASSRSAGSQPMQPNTSQPSARNPNVRTPAYPPAARGPTPLPPVQAYRRQPGRTSN